MNKKRLLIIGGIAILGFTGYSFLSSSDSENTMIISKVKKGDFESIIVSSGELSSINSKQIKAPVALTKHRIREIKLKDIVTEGTVIKEGDYVATLDPTEIFELISDANLNLEGAMSKFTQQQLDTTLNLKQERTAIKDLEFSIQTTELELKQSIYEPPATIRKLEINLEKSKRDLKEKKENYIIKQKQARAKMIEVGTEVSKFQNKRDDLLKLKESLVVHSESAGMIIYAKDWYGKKKKSGSSFSVWDLTLATIPDLSQMESKTYANEVDVRKIKKGMTAKIGFDAFPELEIEGVVTDVANIAETKGDSDVKLFPVTIKLNTTNENIRPGMTTSNAILTFKEDEVLSIPLEAIFTKDSINYVYKKDGFSKVKQQVILGQSNDNEVVVQKGLKADEEILLTEPSGLEDKKINRIE
ncbi:efflux RND transporter periplasmic adaptor subunit [Aureivirga sp. CE67]|uniref:efflux RND transporter periplasmic adaptor subunit n=1 Tax=Aureivirga sp. CE67 TaxID=1788983 RepID=UPI0018C91529|nr:HlyD family efflux transporter periplasmic adaptor subunit [Aureivirga sp. CE67]